MAAVTTKNGNFIEVSYQTSGSDWNYTATGLDNLKVKAIFWHPTAANDVLYIREGSNSGPAIVYTKASADTDTKAFYFDNGVWMKPYIKISDQTFGTVTATKIIFVIE